MHLLRPRYGLGMLRGTYEIVHGGARLQGLSMTNGGCALPMPIYFKPWGIKKCPVPYMM